MLQLVDKAVLCELSFDGVARSACAVAVRAAALDHEAADDAVKDQTVIEAFFYKADKVIDCVRRDLRVKLRFHDVAVFHSDRYDWVLCHNLVPFLIIDLFSAAPSVIKNHLVQFCVCSIIVREYDMKSIFLQV